MTSYQITVVHCDDSDARLSRFSDCKISADEIDHRLIETIEQRLDPGVERELHNAAHHEEHGPLTYLQQIQEGGFSVFVGEPGRLQERFFEKGRWVAFIDDQGPGHASKFGPQGVTRTLRVLKGHLQLST